MSGSPLLSSWATATILWIAASCAAPASAPKETATVSHHTAGRSANPWSLLGGARRDPSNGLIAPRTWVEERPDLDGLWPSAAAGSLQETWIVSPPATVCREAVWGNGVADLASSAPMWIALTSNLAPASATPQPRREESRRAKIEKDGTRLILEEVRACMLHDCHPPLAPPRTRLLVCVEIPPEAAVTAVRALAALFESTTWYSRMPAIDGFVPTLASYQRNANADRGELDFLATRSGQARVRSWLIDQRIVVPRPGTAWQVDAAHAELELRFAEEPNDVDNVVSVHADR